jgi:predicted O-methyltransferase YrrM
VNPDRRRFADQLYATSHDHDQQTEERLERFRNLEPATAELLGVLVRACGARRVLELGTSNGYSTLWLADAVEATGGELVSVDIDAARSAIARDTLAQAQLADRVELKTEDAELTLRESGDEDWDLIFLDSERPAYPSYLPDLLRTLRPGGMLAIDNVVSHRHELTEFTALIEAEPSLTQTVVAIGAGLRLVVRDRET